MNSSFLFRILTVIGIALIGTGLVAIKVVEDPQGIMRSLLYSPLTDLDNLYEAGSIMVRE